MPVKEAVTLERSAVIPEVNFDITAGESEEIIQRNLMASFNVASEKSPYRARLYDPRTKGEDESNLGSFLTFENKELSANQIFTAVRAEPGQASGLGFEVEGIGRYSKGELLQVGIELLTGPTGAAGGTISLAQRSPTGFCRLSVRTSRNDEASQVAARLLAAVESMSAPGTWECESRHNSYDLQVKGRKIITSSALGFAIEINDSGIGLSISPLSKD